MSKLIIVESKKDVAFFQALSKYLQGSIRTVDLGEDTEMLQIYPLKGLDKLKLELQNAKDRSNDPYKNLQKLGILIDADYKNTGEGEQRGGVTNRLKLINTIVNEVFGSNPNFSDIHQATQHFASLEYTTDNDEIVEIQIACFLVNVDGEGELETLMKLIAKQPANYANCLDAWETCYLQKNIPETHQITKKELVKKWVDFYKEFDILARNERDGSHTLIKMLQNRSADMFNFEHPHPDFQNLCRFLKSFA